MERIARIKHMESIYDEIRYVFQTNKDQLYINDTLQKNLELLKDYYENGQWLLDYEADERGELPKNLKRGVLSQDGLYNLLEEIGKVKRCKWCNLKNPLYIKYHDEEWGRLNLDDQYLYEMLILESFQAGLSWECVLNKRESFRKAYDNFQLEKVCAYGEDKFDELVNNQDIIRNKLKIKASINNSKIFKEIQREYGSFRDYLKIFTNDEIIYEIGRTTNELSDAISMDLQKRGMKFVGSVIIYSYLQAIGMIYSHEEDCFLYKEEDKK